MFLLCDWSMIMRGIHMKHDVQNPFALSSSLSVRKASSLHDFTVMLA